MVDNITTFNIQVLRAVGHLYKTHPTVGILQSKQLLLTGEDDQLEQANGTTLWLTRNGIVSGTYGTSGSISYINQAQLTARALRVLATQDQNVGLLGQAVLSVLEERGGRDLPIIAERLAAQLGSA